MLTPAVAGPKPHQCVFTNSFPDANLLTPALRQTPPSLAIRTSHASSGPSDAMSSRTIVPPSSQRQHRWSELVPPQTALTFVAMYDPADGLLTFSGAELLPSEPPTPPTPHTPSSSPDTPDTPTTTAFSPMPSTPAPRTLAAMQTPLHASFRPPSTTPTTTTSLS